MKLDIELYRQQILVSHSPNVHLSVIDIAPEKPDKTLVFVHGFGGQATQWKYQLQHFCWRNRVIAYDLRGHGRSDAPHSEYTMAEMQNDLEAVLEKCGVNSPFVLVGHSFGGAIVTQFALNFPEKLTNLVLVASASEYKIKPPFRTIIERTPLRILNLLRPFTKSWLFGKMHALQAIHNRTLLRWKGTPLFRQIRVPTLIVRGHWDAVFEQAYFQTLGEIIPDSREVNVGYSGHMVMLERREAVNRTLDGFIEDKKLSWREQLHDQRPQWLKERPWLTHYNEEVPYTIAIPAVPLQALLKSAVERFSRRPAINFYGNEISYRKLYSQSRQFAAMLQQLGMQAGERVMLILPNIPQTIYALYGTLMAGGVAVLTVPIAPKAEILHQARHAQVKIVLTIPECWDTLQEIRRENDLRAAILTSPTQYLPWLAQLFRKRTAPPSDPHIQQLSSLMAKTNHDWIEHPCQPDDLAIIQYTSGTTSLAKGVMLSHRNLVANTLQTRHWIPSVEDGAEKVLSVLPFSHSYGLLTALNMPIALGATMLVLPRFNIEEVLRTIQKEKPSFFPGIPQMYMQLSDFSGIRKYGIRSIRACISGSSPLPVEVQESFERLTKGRLVEGYGLTEAAPVTHANPIYGKRKIGSIGIPLPNTSAQILDLASGKPVPVGQIGELAIRGPQVMQGYWNDAENTAQTLRDGWLMTGDIARMDEDGFFQIISRKADMWYPDKSPQQPFFPRDVEEVLFEIPQIKEAVVTAIANQPIAFVIAGKEKPSAESIVRYCQRRLPPELVPRLVIFVADFPRSFIGKVLRRELQKQYAKSKAPHTH